TDGPAMSVGQLRILAWASAFVAAALVIWTSGKRAEHAAAIQPPAITPAIPPPALFPNGDAAEVLPLVSRDSATETRDHQLQAANVIREPMARSPAPELTPTPYQPRSQLDAL